MTAKANLKKKRVLSAVLITFTAYLLVSMAATKLIYDNIFRRYDPPERSQVSLQREEPCFYAGENRLQGYYYPGREKEILVLLAPGFHAGADSYIQQIRYFQSQGWGVFSFDPTGSYESGGDSYVGFPQEIYDLEAALDFLRAQSFYGYRELVLFGHSRGGYAVCAMADSDHEISAIISVAGVNSAMDAVMEPSADAVGPLAWMQYPFLWLYQSLLFDYETANVEVSDLLKETQIPTLIIHGVSDETVSHDAFSVMAHREEIRSEQVHFLSWQESGAEGHVDILYDPDGSANTELMDEIAAFIRTQTE